MKKYIFIILSFFCVGLTAQNFEWANSMGHWYSDQGNAIITDNQGNVYTTGSFQDTVDFDPGPGVFNLISSGTADIFIQKTDDNGNLIWAKNIGGADYDIGYDITTDNNGYLYITGNYGQTVDFDPGPGIAYLTSGGSFDAFTLKLDTAGNFIWANKIGDPSTDEGNAIVIDNDGNLITVGTFGGNSDFDPGPGTYYLDASSGSDVYIRKLDPLGNFIWAANVGGSYAAWGHDVSTDQNNNIYTVGTFQGTTNDFDPGAGTFNLVSTGLEDMFILKLNSTGNFVWAKKTGSTAADDVRSIINDLQGNIYTTGYFGGATDFDPNAGTSILSLSGYEDIFIQKLDSNGNFIWAKKLGGTLSEIANGLATDTAENIYITGYFEGTIDTDPGPGINNITSNGNSDVFIEKINSSGNLVWCKQIGGPQTDVGYELAVDLYNSLYITGSYSSTVDFDPDTSSFSLSDYGSGDVFVVKLSPDFCSNMALVIDSVHDYTCASLSGYASAHLEGGLPIYNYTWNTSPPTNDSVAIFTLGRIYQLDASDQHGCFRTTSILINAPAYNNEFDLNANLISDPFRPGFGSNIWVDAYNDGCDTTSSTLTLILDTLITFNTANPAPDVLNGDTIIWYIQPMNYDSVHFIPIVQVTTDTSAVLGDSVFLKLSIQPTIGDADTSNNVKNYVSEIINGYDPNDKKVYPAGICDQQYVLLNEPLTFTIRFQNTGNADAINIHILDSLDSNLDIHSIRVVGNSHPLVTEVLPGNVLNFKFNNIHLPDSNTNEPLSHGYIVFEVMPDSMINSGTVVENTASIYFDFNPAVVTNSTLNTLVDLIPTCNTSGIIEEDWTNTYKVYPNPADDQITILSEIELKNVLISISDINGKNLLNKPGVSGNQCSVNIAHLNPGLYFLHIRSAEKTWVFKIIKN
jgi:uncharacterized repeat protein (TIGR01451 family)